MQLWHPKTYLPISNLCTAPGTLLRCLLLLTIQVLQHFSLESLRRNAIFSDSRRQLHFQGDRSQIDDHLSTQFSCKVESREKRKQVNLRAKPLLQPLINLQLIIITLTRNCLEASLVRVCLSVGARRKRKSRSPFCNWIITHNSSCL